MKKIVVNNCYGGFGLSDKALLRYCELKKLNAIDEDDIPRDDKILISVIEEMGEESFGDYADLKILEIPDDVDWVINEYDGVEWVTEKCRIWRWYGDSTIEETNE